MNKLFPLLTVAVLLAAASCKKDKVGSKSCNGPATAVPEEMVGNWVNGYASLTQIIDAYNGQFLGNAWQSGRYLHLQADGRNAELYVLAGSMYSEFATRINGTVTFNEAAGTFQFHACEAHYKGWKNGQLAVNRPATPAEKEQLTENNQFYYYFEVSGGTKWLRLAFEPGGSASSFRQVD